jgi:hypothetical protein
MAVFLFCLHRSVNIVAMLQRPRNPDLISDRGRDFSLYSVQKPRTTILMALQPFVGPWPLFRFFIFFTQSVGILGRGISPSQGRYLHIGQHKHRINADIHASSGIQTHDPSVCEGQDSSCLRLRDHCDRPRSLNFI